MKPSTAQESTFNGLCNMESAIARHIHTHRIAGNVALVAHLEVLLAQVQLSKGAALEAAGKENRS
jgi:hypothetical protein